MASRSYTAPSRFDMASTSKMKSSNFEKHATRSKTLKLTSPSSSQPKKRKVVDYDKEDEFAASMTQNAIAGIDDSVEFKKARKSIDEERRLKRFRSGPPQSYIERLGRVRSQRMFLINRERRMSENGTHEEEVFDLAGSTGNIYQVTIGKLPSCTCPDNCKGNQCKHIIYVMVKILKAREDLAYQLALLSTELAEIFANAPANPQSYEETAASLTTDTGGSRKPIDGDCPVCAMEFDTSDKCEDIIWCKAACGQNIHRACFEQWARSKPGVVKCVYCRSTWKGDEDTVKKINKSGRVNVEGYVNVARELGISGQRDTSSYHQSWVCRTYGGRRYGYGDDDGY